MTLRALIVVYAASLLPMTSRAQTCDDGDGDTSCPFSSGHNTATPTEERCLDSTEITGLEECSSFGRGWNAEGIPALGIDFDLNYASIPTNRFPTTGTATHDSTRHTYNIPRAAHLGSGQRSSLFGAGLRGWSFVTGALFIGAEFRFGMGASPFGSMVDGSLRVNTDTLTTLGGGFLTGSSLGIGRLRIRGELLLGGQAFGVTSTTHRRDCVTSSTSWSSSWLVEPRLAVEWFASPWISVGARFGSNVLRPGEYTGTLTLRLHLRSYDAR